VKGALSRLRPEERFFVEGPLGVFKLRASKSPQVFFSKKTGIAPICSMARTLISRKARPPIYIFSENAVREDIPDEQELRKCAKEKGVFLSISLLNQKPLLWDGKIGELSADDITKNIKNYGNAQFYVCGPVPFVNRMRSVLGELRVQEKNILFEQWG
jgi:predicted ferric reductase